MSITGRNFTLALKFVKKLASLREAVTLALTLRELLDDVGLRGFPKTSGKTGLHVLVPVGPGVPFDVTRALAELFGGLLVAEHPKIATMERRVSDRGDPPVRGAMAEGKWCSPSCS